MRSDSLTLTVVSDFNTANLSTMMMKHSHMLESRVTVAPFGQVYECLLNEDHTCWADDPQGSLVWTQPTSISKSFGELISFQTVSIEKILPEVDQFADAVIAVAKRLDWVLVPTWTMPAHLRGYGMLDMANGIGHANALARMNLHLVDRLSEARNIYVLDVHRWIVESERRSYDANLWYMGKIPFGNSVFKVAVEEIGAACQGIRGFARKLVVVDLDDTLWGGIVGDEGWENLRLGGHDPVGEAFVEFQRCLKALTARGILLAVVSKNDEAVALDAMQNHPEMLIRKEDLSAWRINWSDKAANIVDLVSGLNLGLQSTVFIDDNPVERARVRDSLPEVFVPEWPKDKMKYVEAFSRLRCFDTPSVSREDLERAKMYAQEQKRVSVREALPSLEEWIASLEMKIQVQELNKANLPRAAQLLNKTNQMNMATRRMSEAELWTWLQDEHHHFLTFRVQDKFGDSGLTGLMSLEIEASTGRVADFVLSCRVMGRGVEQTMLHVLVEHTKKMGLDRIEARMVPTPKNGPCREFWESASRFTPEEDLLFVWDPGTPYELPAGIEVVRGVDALNKAR